MSSDGEHGTQNRALSEIQRRILDAFERYERREGRPPTVRELGQAVGISGTGHVAHHLKMLEKRGYIITRERGISRGRHLTREPGVPILGKIAAGAPLDLFEPSEEHYLPLTLTAREGAQEYALCVRGDSMIEDGILDGDCILVRRDGEVRNGEIVVAVHLTADTPLGAATVKRLQKLPGSVILEPANAAHEPREIPAAEWAREWEVHGVVVGVYRPYPKLPWHARRQHDQR